MPPRYPCSVCARSVGLNCIECAKCRHWVHARSLSQLGVDEFFATGLNTDSESDDDQNSMDTSNSSKHAKQRVKPSAAAAKSKNSTASNIQNKPTKKKDITKQDVKKLDSSKTKNNKKDKNKKEEKSASLPKVSKLQDHKQSLEKLKEKDPEFYKFLENEDKGLLNPETREGDEEMDSDEEEENMSTADESDDDSDFSYPESTDEEEDDGKSKNTTHQKKSSKETASVDFSESDSDDSDGSDKYHKMPEKLEVASDEDEDEDEEEEEGESKKKGSKKILVTVKMVSQWSESLQVHSSLKALHQLTLSLRAAVDQAKSRDKQTGTKYRVNGSTVFNAIVRTCMVDVPPALARILPVKKAKNAAPPVMPSTCPRWKKVVPDLKSYLRDIMELLGQLAEPMVLNVVLKHVNQMANYFSCFPRHTQFLIKRLVTIWSTGEETGRVLAFLSINKLVRLKQDALLEPTMKKMYMAFVKNSKFTSPTTLPLIGFMQRSLVEMFAINLDLGYQYGFVYIRQLAIHLRNAITVKKKDTAQAVYNWQYVHCLRLWALLLAHTHSKEALQPLIYPLTQTVIGTIKLTPTERFYPLRFHCVQTLNIISETTRTYIPVLPFLTEVLELTDFNKRHKSINAKPFDFACILKFTKPQLYEKVFKDGVMEQLYEHFLHHFSIWAHTISFPELVLPTLIEMKKFLKQCKVANYTKQIKQLVVKLEETSKMISQRRRTSGLSLQDTQGVVAWERRSKESGTPMATFHSTYRRLRDRELREDAAKKDEISTDNLPTIQRHKGPPKPSTEDREEFAALFDRPDEDSDDETRFLPRDERPVKKQKLAAGSDHSDTTDSEQEADSDWDSDELEKLGQSASDEDEEDDDDDDDEDGDDESEDAVDDVKPTKSKKGLSGKEKQKSKEQTQKPDLDGTDESDAEDIVEEFKFSSDEDD